MVEMTLITVEYIAPDSRGPRQIGMFNTLALTQYEMLDRAEALARKMDRGRVMFIVAFRKEEEKESGMVRFKSRTMKFEYMSPIGEDFSLPEEMLESSLSDKDVDGDMRFLLHWILCLMGRIDGDMMTATFEGIKDGVKGWMKEMKKLGEAMKDTSVSVKELTKAIEDVPRIPDK